MPASILRAGFFIPNLTFPAFIGMWENLTIYQFQQIAKIIEQFPKDGTDIELEADIIALMEGINVDKLSLREFKELRGKYAYLLQPIPDGKPANTFRVGNAKYGVIYDVSNINYGQYNEVVQFASGNKVIPNLHKLMATICVPMKRNMFGLWVVDRDKKTHNVIADEMLKAPFLVCYQAAVFFYQVFKGFLQVMKEPFLIQIMKIQKVNKEQAQEIYQHLMNSMGGYTMLKL